MLHEGIIGLANSYALGLGTPLTALCVLPLYPGFLAYVANADEDLTPTKISVLVATGVISFMLIIGILVTAFLQTSLTRFIGIAGPIAYLVMLSLGVNLVVNGVGVRTGFTSIPRPKNPYLAAYTYGLFFSLIALPCNPAFIAFFFANLFQSSALNALTTISNVAVFGLGMATPLIVLALISEQYAKQVITYLADHKHAINVITGLALVLIALYYLIFDFQIIPW
jgi:cytochrome c-type biogenesis protein